MWSPTDQQDIQCASRCRSKGLQCLRDAHHQDLQFSTLARSQSRQCSSCVRSQGRQYPSWDRRQGRQRSCCTRNQGRQCASCDRSSPLEPCSNWQGLSHAHIRPRKEDGEPGSHRTTFYNSTESSQVEKTCFRFFWLPQIKKRKMGNKTSHFSFIYIIIYTCLKGNPCPTVLYRENRREGMGVYSHKNRLVV